MPLSLSTPSLPPSLSPSLPSPPAPALVGFLWKFGKAYLNLFAGWVGEFQNQGF